MYSQQGPFQRQGSTKEKFEHLFDGSSCYAISNWLEEAEGLAGYKLNLKVNSSSEPGATKASSKRRIPNPKDGNCQDRIYWVESSANPKQDSDQNGRRLPVPKIKLKSTRFVKMSSEKQKRFHGRPWAGFNKLNKMHKTNSWRELPFTIDRCNWHMDKFSLIKARRKHSEKYRINRTYCKKYPTKDVEMFSDESESSNNTENGDFLPLLQRLDNDLKDNGTLSLNLRTLKSPINESQLCKHYPNMFKKRPKIMLSRITDDLDHRQCISYETTSRPYQYCKSEEDRKVTLNVDGEHFVKNVYSDEFVASIDTEKMITPEKLERIRSKLKCVSTAVLNKSKSANDTIKTLDFSEESSNNLGVTLKKSTSPEDLRNDGNSEVYEREAPSLIEIDRCDSYIFPSSIDMSIPPVLEMECTEPYVYVETDENMDAPISLSESRMYGDDDAPVLDPSVSFTDATMMVPEEPYPVDDAVVPKDDMSVYSKFEVFLYKDSNQNITEQNSKCETFIGEERCGGTTSYKDNTCNITETIQSADTPEKENVVKVKVNIPAQEKGLKGITIVCMDTDPSQVIFPAETDAESSSVSQKDHMQFSDVDKTECSPIQMTEEVESRIIQDTPQEGKPSESNSEEQQTETYYDSDATVIYSDDLEDIEKDVEGVVPADTETNNTEPIQSEVHTPTCDETTDTFDQKKYMSMRSPEHETPDMTSLMNDEATENRHIKTKTKRRTKSRPKDNTSSQKDKTKSKRRTNGHLKHKAKSSNAQLLKDNNNQNQTNSLTLTITRQPVKRKQKTPSKKICSDNMKATSKTKSSAFKTKSRQGKKIEGILNPHSNSNSECQPTPILEFPTEKNSERSSKSQRDGKKEKTRRKRKNGKEDVLCSIDKVFPQRKVTKSDDDDLPTILPPKRRRLTNIRKSNEMKQSSDSGMERIIQEFPRHNWLENKYKKDHQKDTQDDSNGDNVVTNDSRNINSPANITGQMTSSGCPENTSETNPNVDSQESENMSSDNTNSGVVNQRSNDGRLVPEPQSNSSEADRAADDVAPVVIDWQERGDPRQIQCEQSINPAAPDETNKQANQHDGVEALNLAGCDAQSDTHNGNSAGNVNSKGDSASMTSPSCEIAQNRPCVNDSLPPIPQLIPAQSVVTPAVRPTINSPEQIHPPASSTTFKRTEIVANIAPSDSRINCIGTNFDTALKQSRNASLPESKTTNKSKHIILSDASIPNTSININPTYSVVSCAGQTSIACNFIEQTRPTFSSQPHHGILNGPTIHPHKVSAIPNRLSNYHTANADKRMLEVSKNRKIAIARNNTSRGTRNHINGQTVNSQNNVSHGNTHVQPEVNINNMVPDPSKMFSPADNVRGMEYERALQEFQELEKLAELKAKERDELLSLRERKMNELCKMHLARAPAERSVKGLEEQRKHDKAKMSNEGKNVPPPAHMKQRENIYEVLKKLDNHAAIPAHIMSSCPYRSRKNPVMRAPDSLEPIIDNSRPLAAHSRTAFEDHGSTYPIPSHTQKNLVIDKRKTVSTPSVAAAAKSFERSPSAPSTCHHYSQSNQINGCVKNNDNTIPTNKGKSQVMSNQELRRGLNGTETGPGPEMRQGVKRTNSDTIVDLSGSCSDANSKIDKQRTELEIQRELHAAVAIKRQKQEAVAKIDTSKVIDLNKNVRASDTGMRPAENAPQRNQTVLMDLSQKSRMMHPQNVPVGLQVSHNGHQSIVNLQNTQLTKELLRSHPMFMKTRPQVPMVTDQTIEVSNRPRSIPYAQINSPIVSQSEYRHQSVNIPVQVNHHLRPQSVRLLGAAVMSQGQNRPYNPGYPTTVIPGKPNIINSAFRQPITGSIQQGTPIRGLALQTLDVHNQNQQLNTMPSSTCAESTQMQTLVTYSASRDSSVLPPTVPLQHQERLPQIQQNLNQNQPRPEVFNPPFPATTVRHAVPVVTNQVTHINGVCKMCSKFACYLCSNCQKYWYCSQECQLKHWVTHQNECRMTTAAPSKPSTPVTS